MSVKPHLILSAESITVDVSACGVVHTLTIFRPDLATAALLKAIKKGDLFDGCALVDKYDDHTVDHHTATHRYEVVHHFHGSARKIHTSTLILINQDQICRLA